MLRCIYLPCPTAMQSLQFSHHSMHGRLTVLCCFKRLLSPGKSAPELTWLLVTMNPGYSLLSVLVTLF